MKPKITCSILCYNYGSFLSQAIDSCLNQTIDKSLFEVLVIDDGSTDNTPEICARYGNQIRVSRTVNQGFSRSLSRGIEEANGEYVAYMDADDWWAPNKLEKILKVINDTCLVVIHPLQEVDGEGNLLGNIGACGNTSSVCVHREAALTLLPATSEIFARPLLDYGKGVIINEPLGYYRIHIKSMTDRSADSAHTAFFAKTSHVTADRLFELANNPPFWADSKEGILKLALWYRSEGKIKDFQRVTELKDKKRYLASWGQMITSMLKSRRGFGKREFRFSVRAILQALNIK
ncbi:glycosyl transferase family 2 [Mucilaginibacter gracilis]|uniref:Glycosyl transferase family 2 n=1 Tax=Mucilaginibacter gracilis TaxID=423350 RepID=A0A495IZW1_9SPHI|nr:glycosyltransferase family 2 protein [Mucilaginibacter gracilis]RKR82250.1 glycosyl transferase family 2 [Mucilaginibacter gracilis]